MSGRVRTLAAVLDRYLLLFVLATAAAGVLLPGAGRAVDDHAGIPVVLSLLVLTAGVSVPGAALRRLGGVIRPLAVVLVAGTILLPGLAWLASRLVTEPALRHGVLAAGVAPAEVAAVALSALAYADTAVAAALLIGSTVATVALAGPLLQLLADGAVDIDSTGLLLTLALVVVLPLAVGIGARARWPHVAALHIGARLLGTLTLLALVYLVAVQIPHSLAYLPVIPAVLAYLAGAVLLGWLLARRFDPARRLAVLLPIGMRDFAVAAGIATTAFGPAAAAPLGVYGVLVLVFGTLTTRHVARSSTTRT